MDHCQTHPNAKRLRAFRNEKAAEDSAGSPDHISSDSEQASRGPELSKEIQRHAASLCRALLALPLEGFDVVRTTEPLDCGGLGAEVHSKWKAIGVVLIADS